MQEFASNGAGVGRGRQRFASEFRTQRYTHGAGGQREQFAGNLGVDLCQGRLECTVSAA
ncbi:hypothetical protein D3C86_2243520 [compost metagenome]